MAAARSAACCHGMALKCEHTRIPVPITIAAGVPAWGYAKSNRARTLANWVSRLLLPERAEAFQQHHNSRLAISSSITSVAPPPIDCTRASRDMRSIADSRM